MSRAAGSTRGSDLTSLTLPPTGGPVGEPPLPAELAHGLTAKPLSPGRLALRRFLRHKAAVASLVVLVVLVLMVIFAQHFSKYGETATGTGPAFPGPSRAHLFGTDSTGRDQYARGLLGGRPSPFVG